MKKGETKFCLAFLGDFHKNYRLGGGETLAIKRGLQLLSRRRQILSYA
jgi:hypothetical protein